MAKPVVFVIGATGNVGSATLQALSATNTLVQRASPSNFPHTLPARIDSRDRTERSNIPTGGYPEWQVDGILELYKFIDSGSPVTNEADTDDYTQITGEQPTNLKAWVAKVAGAFK